MWYHRYKWCNDIMWNNVITRNYVLYRNITWYPKIWNTRFRISESRDIEISRYLDTFRVLFITRNKRIIPFSNGINLLFLCNPRLGISGSSRTCFRTPQNRTHFRTLFGVHNGGPISGTLLVRVRYISGFLLIHVKQLNRRSNTMLLHGIFL